jgi:L-alanine-DL-glutamate epimerase-like enolase superfamily enzyme
LRIARLDCLYADAGWRNFSFLKLVTDEGLVGWAEFNDGFGAGGVGDIVQRLAQHAVGQDPREVGRLSTSLRAMTRLAAGGLNHQAVAAIENACLDVKAKALGVPVHALFGGKHRDRLSLYWSHCASFRAWNPELFEKTLGFSPVRTLDDVKSLAAEAAKRGFKALKTNPLNLDPAAPRFNSGFRQGPGMGERHPDGRYIASICDVLAAFRAGAGPHMGILFDLNFNQRTEGFRRIAKAVEKFDLTWLEMDIADPDALALIRRSSATPVASLEGIHGLGAYRPFLAAGAVDITIVDVLWNGMWESVRIAALADAYEVDVAPHNFTGHLSTLISAHFCAAIPNFRIMEIEVDDVPWKDELVTAPPVIENGALVVPTAPGWGADVNEEAVRAHPPKRRG